MSRKRLAEFTYLAANDHIHMNPAGQTRVPGDGRPRTAAAGMMMNLKNHLTKHLLHVRLLLLTCCS